MNKKILVSDLSYGDEEIAAVTKVIHSQWMTMGPITTQFEDHFSKYVNYPFAIATSSATAALHLSLMECNLKAQDEIITTPISFVASTNCILYERCKPVFADIDSATWNIDPETVRNRITSKTKAIIVVHYAGLPVELDEICEICIDNDVLLIEDSAHAIGAKYKGKHVGGFGEFGCFSFFSNKNLSTGEGGMIVVKEEKMAQNLRIRRSHGLTKSTWSRHVSKEVAEDKLYDMTLLGYNYRIGELQAAIGLEQLKKLDITNKIREELYLYYKKRVQEENLGHAIQFQKIPENVHHSHHILPVLLKRGNRKEFRDFLGKNNIGTSIHYTPIPQFTYYKKLGYSGGDLPVANHYGYNTTTLPLHQNLTEEDVDYIVSIIKIFFDKS